MAETSPSLRDWQIEPVGDRCVLVRLGQVVDAGTSRTVHAVTRLLTASQLPGVVEVVPAFTTVAVHYQPRAFPREAGPASEQLTAQLWRLLEQDLAEDARTGRVIEIPACYGGEFGPDLETVARHCGLAVEEVIALHSQAPFMIYAFFFTPGQPFAGPLDPRLQIGRRATPRTRVEAGTISIANGLTAINQTASPNGWNVIARTPLGLFDPQAQPPARLRLEDRIHFRPVTPEEYRDLQEARA